MGKQKYIEVYTVKREGQYFHEVSPSREEAIGRIGKEGLYELIKSNVRALELEPNLPSAKIRKTMELIAG